MVCQPTKEQPQHGGFVAGHPYKPQNRAITRANLMNNYFNLNSVYTEEDFRRRFRMRRHVFKRFVMSCRSIHSFDKSGTEQATLVYKDEYLREPNQEDLNRLVRKAEDRGFWGIIGSLDCMHWDWKKCPTGWQEGFCGRLRKPTVVLDAVALYDTWIWHAFFGVPGSQNEITILECSPIFNRLTEGKPPQLDYYINDRKYNMGYYLANGIYPKWATLVQAIPNPMNDVEKLFTLHHQKAYGKDVERAFGILQAQWKIISEPVKAWSRENLDSVMMSGIILHNMIVEDERDGYIDGESDDDQEDPNRSKRAHTKIYDGPNLPFNPRIGSISINEYMRHYGMICSGATNKYLQQDLVAHLWAKRRLE
ncbi:uncharacterized protein [Malus domestica]|uniref:uncharacterized protein n=1 Tax=Malus domestica TaxID=3750 RepID=UPI003976DAA6